MDPVNSINSVACNGLVIDSSDFILILVGCGVGYFVIGYLCMKSAHLCFRRQTEIKTEETEPVIQV